MSTCRNRGGGQIILISKVSETHFSVIYVFWALSIFSATAWKRSRGDVFRRETVLSDDRMTVCLSKFFKV